MKRFALHQSIVLSIILAPSHRHGAAGRYVHLPGRDRLASLGRGDSETPGAAARQFYLRYIGAVALFLRFALERIAAIPIAGIAAM